MMEQKLRRILSLLVAFMMLLGSVGTLSLGEEDKNETVIEQSLDLTQESNTPEDTTPEETQTLAQDEAVTDETPNAPDEQTEGATDAQDEKTQEPAADATGEGNGAEDEADETSGENAGEVSDANADEISDGNADTALDETPDVNEPDANENDEPEASDGQDEDAADETEDDEPKETAPIAFSAETTIEGVKIMLSAEAGVVGEGESVSVYKAQNAVFAAKAEKELNADESAIVTHHLFALSGATLNGSLLVKIEGLGLHEIKDRYPDAQKQVKLFFDGAEIEKLGANVSFERDSVLFETTRMGLYDIVVVIVPAQDGEAEEEQPTMPSEEGEADENVDLPAVENEETAQAEENTDETDNEPKAPETEEMNQTGEEETNAETTNGETDEAAQEDEVKEDEKAQEDEEAQEDEKAQEGEVKEDEEVKENEEVQEDEEAQEDEEIIYTATDVVVETAYLGGEADNDRLFTGYVQQMFNANFASSRRKLRSSASVGSRLEGENNIALYSFLRGKVSEVASGDLSSTVFVVPDGTLTPVDRGPWTAEQLGVDSLIIFDEERQENVLNPDAVAAAKAKYSLGIDIRAVNSALVADCPYDLYWYMKTQEVENGQKVGGIGISNSFHYLSDGTTLSVTGETTLTMAVAKDYRANNDLNTVNSDKVATAKTAAAKAQEIVSQNAGKSVMERLRAYKEAICELVEYNHAAADNDDTPYGDPWQLVNVFDGDTSTNVVCEGYSKAFKYLCDLDGGITCLLVTGKMSTEPNTDGENHMWNLVVLDGQSYFVDVTNCDTGSVGAPDLLFMKTDADGTWDDYSFPCNGDNVHYVYDDSTKANFSQQTLTVTTQDVDDTLPAFNGHSIVLTGRVGVDFYMALPGGAEAFEGSYMTFEGNKLDSEKQYATPENPVSASDARYKYTVFVSSIQLADKITPTFHYTVDGEEKTVVGDPYSAEDYLNWALGSGSNVLTAKQRAIVSALADYGYHAQIYLSEQNGWTIGTDYAKQTKYISASFDHSAVTSATEASAIVKTLGSDVENSTYRLIFGNVLSLRIYFQPAEGETITSVTIKGNSVTPEKEGKRYYVEISGIYANQLTDTYTITTGGGTEIRVSAMSYVYSMLSASNTSDAGKNIVCALYNYANACK